MGICSLYGPQRSVNQSEMNASIVDEMRFKLRNTGGNQKEICLICINSVIQCRGKKGKTDEALEAGEVPCMAVVYRKRKMSQ